jgi:hypothetical protein
MIATASLHPQRRRRNHPIPVGQGLMFISLNVEPATREAAVAALDALRAELEARGVPVKEGLWGYRLLVVDDPDGNQLFFNYPSETASGIARDEAQSSSLAGTRAAAAEAGGVC